MSNIENVKNFLSFKKIRICDDCLSEELNILPRQQVNQICNKLLKCREIKREKSGCDICKKDKLVNYL